MSELNHNQPSHAPALERARQAAVRPRKDKDGLVRACYQLPRDEARATAQQWLDDFPKAAYWTRVESWRLLPDETIEFTMVRLPTAD
ncbi:hypothetical protein ACFQ14_05065 [Pseudahrensia aquimaris]|uniref:Uncharacterized protein n=1 Tax=Pseudahrensia aquimaris TaxID=744461 RepID=A0ABW3FBD4_9HYPH